MRRHIGDGEFVGHHRCHRRALTQINVHGPKSRALLQRISGADLTNEGFPFMTAREIDVGYAIVLAYPCDLHRRTGLGTARARHASRAGL